ncbi:hypothetical protein VHEMI09829 [[Torrubiella] hemipterigena]|uniref:Uncharacterized protein n=1 Tax=[Torrubiella] hemipterigena TaxID=1531966 RepID=A0A0A1TR25_9HYPO|nr:hypothetical protein VHEMI09829 [[Torrubiella] hemipterigena]
MISWNALGLGVAASFAFLGTVSVAQPSVAEDLFGVAKMQAPSPVRQLDSHSFSILLGGRDMAIGVSIFLLAREGNTKSMGTVILSTLCVCLPDLYLVWRNKRYQDLAVMSIATVAAGVIGAGLRGWL